MFTWYRDQVRQFGFVAANHSPLSCCDLAHPGQRFEQIAARCAVVSLLRMVGEKVLRLHRGWIHRS